MAEYNEWTQKNATLSEVTAISEYGIEREFIIKGIKAGILEYRQGTVYGNPFLRILRSQLEKYIVKELGEEYLIKVNGESELRKIKREMTSIKKRLNALQIRKTTLEEVLNK